MSTEGSLSDRQSAKACCQESFATGTLEWRPRPIDLFVVFNLILFIIMASSIYWQRFVLFMGRANLPEFVVYATVIIAGIVFGWVALRPLPVSVPVLACLEVGLLLHFAGGLVFSGGMRLYDHRIGLYFFDYPLRFDKIVHLANALLGCIVTLESFRLLRVRFPRGLVFFTSLVVVGVGAFIEIVEYMVMKTIPHNGVGDYDNNMTDMLANLIGCLLFALLWRVARFRRRFPVPDQEP